jgi:predicted phage terminase large subunit-like protein
MSAVSADGFSLDLPEELPLPAAIRAARAELASRELARRHFLPFVQRFNPAYDAGWVHKIVAEKLEEFSEKVARKESPRLMIFMPFRSGKSELTSRRYPSWHLGKYPQHEFIAASHTVNLSMGFSRRNRALLRDNDYQLIFDTRLDPDSQSAEEWMTTEGGGYLAAGVGSGIAGRGAHVLMIDDPVRSMEDADSATVRDDVWDWYTADAYSRLAPGGGIVLIMTRWHEDDLAGRLLAEMKTGGEQWEILNFQAIAEEDEEFRKKGEALHPARYDEAAWARIRKVIGERKFAALCQQHPTPETGHFFTRDMFRYYDPDMLDTSRLVGYQAWDMAVTQNTWSDYTVGITAGMDEFEDLYILDRVRDKLDSYDAVQAICDTFIKWRSILDLVGVEEGQIKKSIEPFLNRVLDEKKLYDLHIMPLPPGRADKAARAQTIRGMMRQGKVWLPHPDKAPWVLELVDEMLRFQAGGSHDDQVDAMAWLGQMVNNMVGFKEKPVKHKASWKDNLTLVQGGLSAMSA